MKAINLMGGDDSDLAHRMEVCGARERTCVVHSSNNCHEAKASQPTLFPIVLRYASQAISSHSSFQHAEYPGSFRAHLPVVLCPWNTCRLQEPRHTRTEGLPHAILNLIKDCSCFHLQYSSPSCNTITRHLLIISLYRLYLSHFRLVLNAKDSTPLGSFSLEQLSLAMTNLTTPSNHLLRGTLKSPPFMNFNDQVFEKHLPGADFINTLPPFCEPEGPPSTDGSVSTIAADTETRTAGTTINASDFNASSYCA